MVNDNCHALGASYKGSIHYAAKYADLVTQSYHPVKNFTTGEGGAVLTNDSNIDSKIRALRSHGMTKNINELEKCDGLWYYEMHEPGFNYRITDLQCALGSSQLKKLDNFVMKRREIAIFYDHKFSSNDFFTTPLVKENIKHAYHLYPLLINFEKINISKKSLFLKKCFSQV